MSLTPKHAQAGAQVASVIIVIALFMTLYILFIPPEERSELLGSSNRTATTTSTTTPSERVELLAESPGMLTPTTESATVHRIPSVNIFFKIEPKIISLSDNLFVSNSLFSSSSPKLRFRNQDLDETTRVALFFSVEQVSGGDLRVMINNNLIYSEEIETPGVKIIEIAKSNIKENNELEFKVSSSGILFWKINKYQLKDVSIKQEFERSNKQEERTFTLESNEKESLTSAKLTYFQVCNAQSDNELSSLDILLNDRRIHSAEIRCVTTEEQVELDPDLLLSGTNELKFRLSEGDFSFTQLKVETESRDLDRPTYFFTLSQREYQDVQSGQRNINLHILFEQSQATKNARLLVNNNEVLMETDRNTFDRNLKDFVVEGTNFVKIIPVNSFNMVGLKVTLE